MHMYIPGEIFTVDEARQYAESMLREGVGYIAHALNATSNPNLAYRYSTSTRVRFEEIVIELISMVEHDEVEMLALKRAKSDKDFQSFISKSFNANSKS